MKHLIALCCIHAIACSNSGFTANPHRGETHWDVVLEGAVQKGPFVLGSSINVSPLNNQGESLGQVYSTKTKNDLGEFSLSIDITQESASAVLPISVEGTGYYYNEAKGFLSQAPMTLRALGEISTAENQSLYVNALTHLTYDRTKILVSEKKISYQDAQKQAETELKAALVIVPKTVQINKSANKLNILGESTTIDDAYLLLLSAVLAQSTAGQDAPLQELLNQMQTEFSKNGTLSSNLIDKVNTGLVKLNPNKVVTLLNHRLGDLKSSAKPADLHLVFDTDKDTIVDSSDNCRYDKNPLQEDTDKDDVGDACDSTLVMYKHVGMLGCGVFLENSLYDLYCAVLHTDHPTAEYLKTTAAVEGYGLTSTGHSKSIVDITNSVQALCVLFDDGAIECMGTGFLGRYRQTSMATDQPCSNEPACPPSDPNCEPVTGPTCHMLSKHDSGTLLTTPFSLPAKFSQLVSSPEYMCGLRRDSLAPGTVICWNWQAKEVSPGYTFQEVQPTFAETATQLAANATDFDTLCALLNTSHKVSCRNILGPGIGPFSEIPDLEFSIFDSNSRLGCGVRPDKKGIKCWKPSVLTLLGTYDFPGDFVDVQVAGSKTLCGQYRDGRVECFDTLSDYYGPALNEPAQFAPYDIYFSSFTMANTVGFTASIGHDPLMCGLDTKNALHCW